LTYIILETELDGDTARLDRAWADAESFVFVPAKAGVSGDFLANAIGQLPEEYGRGHFLLLTSGSTGEPKLVLGQRDRTNQLARTLHTIQSSEAVEETLVALPLSYSYAFVNQWRWARLHERRLVYTPGLSDPKALLGALRAANNAMLCMVGAQVQMLVQDFSGETFPGVIRLHFAGGRFPQERLAELRTFFPEAQVFNNYGCAEAMPRLTCRTAEEADEAAHIGRPLPGVELSSGVDEELLFRSPYGAIGFIDCQGFQRIGQEDWVSTGDLGAALPDGSWILRGRRSEVFKRYGERISLPKIAKSVHGVWQGSVGWFREVDRAGEDGFVLVLSPTPDETQVRAILKVLRADYPRAQWPLRIESAQSLPLLPNGKIDGRGLAAMSTKMEHWRQRI
jgi:acyl-CoA synthetase (AMP-forming)/AMP-acid ligase II